ncbi:tyrosine-type recombinase/integrase [Desulfotalea psychrophila]|uniref:Related to integrase n=1 Tax=Desulfotalea psychrophila (strain LSv54 / DSM 12343) TaxID=177439 RepID=Q6ALK6_DESPS|nr:site-specific integrase [Desulfotalea psychrophila]CAG36769.1 related to integrase [Desulfotalea psychrophila LSv54]
MSDNKFNFTKTRLVKIQNTTGKDIHFFDTGMKGLMLRVKANGRKILRARIWDTSKKKEVQENLGEFPELSINDARDIVVARVSDIAKGIDVQERKKQERAEQSLDDVFDIWLNTHAKLNIKRWPEEVRRYELYIKRRLGKKKLSEITPDVILTWRNALLKQKKQRGNDCLSTAMAHRAFVTLSSIFGKAAANIDNPCSKVQRYKEKKRTEFLGSDHLKQFFSRLDHEATDELLRDYLLLSLYTGARQANIRSMRWSEIDLKTQLWIIPADKSKNAEPMVIPLASQAITILAKRKERYGGDFVFISHKSKTGHINEPRRLWKKFLADAELPTSYRFHDIRRTLGSWQAISGSSTKIIGASLGHKSEQATAHYAYLTVDPVRKSVERAIEAMHEAGEKEDVSGENEQL